MTDFLNDVLYIYTDGGCRNNQSLDKSITIGGWSYLLHLNGKEKECAESQRNTTSNREEMYGLINALLVLKRHDLPIIVRPDSNYVLKGCTEWLPKWKQNGWKTSQLEPIKNKDLWVWLDELLQEFPTITFEKVKGHSDDEYNNRVDRLLNDAMDEFEKNIK